MGFSQSFFAERFGITERDLESYLSEALSAGGEYADLYFEYLATSSIGIDEGIVKSATEGVTLGVGVRVIAGERTGYAYSDDLSPEKIRKAARVAARIAKGPASVVKTGFEEAREHNLYPMLHRAARNRAGRARRSGEARRSRRARLRSARVSGAGDLCRQPAPRAGRDQRRPAQLRSPADGADERSGAGARRRRRSAARLFRRRRTRDAGFFPERENAGAFRQRSRAAGDRATGRGGCAGGRDDGGAGSGLAGHSAA